MNSKLKHLKDNKHMLYILKDCKPKMRKALVQNADNGLITTINEIIYNTLNGNNPIDKKTKTKLKKYKKPMRCLICPKKSISAKRKLLVQKGGFLPALITSLLTGIIGKLLENVK